MLVFPHLLFACSVLDGNHEDDVTLQGLIESSVVVKRDKRAACTVYASILQQCGNSKDLPEGKLVHARIVQDGYHQETFLANHLVQMYAKCGSLENACAVFGAMREHNVFSWTIMVAAHAQNGHLQDALEIFAQMPERNVVCWNILIGAYAQNGLGQEAATLFEVMNLEGVQPDKITFINVVEGCIVLAEGQRMHATVVDCGVHIDVELGNAILSMYGRCGSPEHAKATFDRIQQKNVVSWTAMVTAYAQNGHLQEAGFLFENMPQRDVVSWNTMIATYAQHGHLREARFLFDKMPQQSVVSWNVMITAYAQNGHGNMALQLFQVMDIEGVQPNKVTFLVVLDACAQSASLAECKIIHTTIAGSEFQLDAPLGTALVHMYGKCGSPESARSVFDSISQRNVPLWSAMIEAHARNGHGEEALEVFQLMDLDGVKPNEITFIGILSACSHGGLLANSQHYFSSIQADHGMAPVVDHYVCMIDLLGRLGKLEEAEDLIHNMPFEPNVVTWKTLLSACKTHRDDERGRRIAHVVAKLQPVEASPYLMLYNLLYAEAGHG